MHGTAAPGAHASFRRETFGAYLGQDLFYLTAFAEAYTASLDKAAQVRACTLRQADTF